MDKATTAHFKDLFTNILLDAEESDKELGQLDEVLKNRESGDVVDQALGDRDQQLALKLKGRQGFFLKKVKIALDKIEKGTFGTCEECDGDISTSRLLARPTATMCITCKEEQESGEQHISYQKRSHTHGQGITNNNQKVIQLQFTDNTGDNKKGLSGTGSLNL